MLNGNSGIGDSMGNTATGVPGAAGAPLGEPRPWSPFAVIW